MAAAYRSSLNTTAVAAASVAIAKPAGTIQGDVVVVQVTRVTVGTGPSGSATTAPAGGWIQMGTEQVSTASGLTIGVSYFWKSMVAAEPSTWTFSSAGAAQMGGNAATGSGGSALQVTASTVNKGTGTTSFVASAITTTLANALVFSFYSGIVGAVTWTPPGTATERIDTASNEVNSEIVAAAGSIGTRTGTSSGSTDAGWCVCAIEEVQINPGVGALTLTGLAPTVFASDSKTVLPGVGMLTLTGFAPTVAVTTNTYVTPGVGSLVLTGLAPTVVGVANVVVTPGVGSLVLSGLAPTVTATANQQVTPGVGALMLTGFAPTVTATANVQVLPGTGSLTLDGFAPTIVGGQSVEVLPGTGSLVLAGFAPTITVTGNIVIPPDTGNPQNPPGTPDRSQRGGQEGRQEGRQEGKREGRQRPRHPTDWRWMLERKLEQMAGVEDAAPVYVAPEPQETTRVAPRRLEPRPIGPRGKLAPKKAEALYDALDAVETRLDQFFHDSKRHRERQAFADAKAHAEQLRQEAAWRAEEQRMAEEAEQFRQADEDDIEALLLHIHDL